MSNKWTPAVVLSEIRRMHGENVDLSAKQIQHTNLPLYGAAYRFFKGWPKALIAAGLDPEKIRRRKRRPWLKLVDNKTGKTSWTPETVISHIRELMAEGVDLNVKVICQKHDYVHQAARKIFKTWDAALIAAGLNPDKIRKAKPRGWWTKERTLSVIRELFSKDIVPTQETHPRVYAAALKNFGSWKKAVEAAYPTPIEKNKKRQSPTKNFVDGLDEATYRRLLKA